MNIKVFVLALTTALSVGLVLVIANVGFTQNNDPQDHLDTIHNLCKQYLYDDYILESLKAVCSIRLASLTR